MKQTTAIRKDERIDLRLSRPAKLMLQQAAALRHKSVTEFILDSGLASAAETLADRQAFLLDDDQWRTFVSALDGPETAKPELEKLLETKSVFE